MAGNRIVDRDLILRSTETAKEFRKLMRVEMIGRVEQSMEDPQCFRILSVASASRGDDRIVVRPNRAEVIPDGVIGAFLRRQGADAPSTEHVLSHESLDRPLGFVLVRDAGPQRLARIGRDDGGLPPLCL